MAGDMNRQRQEEQEAVRTTIVGGRPPGCGKGVGTVPRGMEILVKKAAIDREFKALLLEKRAAAAESIGLALTPGERMMLSTVPASQLEAIIAATTVPASHVPAFLGKAAVLMLAALGIIQAGCDQSQDAKPAGIRPEDKDRVAATSRPAAPRSPEAGGEMPMTIAGEVIIIRPQARPATAPTTQPQTPYLPAVAGVMAVPGDRPEAFGARPYRIAGIRPVEPPATQPATQPEQKTEPDQTTQPPAEVPNPEPPAVIRGLRADVPVAIVGVTTTSPSIDDSQLRIRGIRPMRPPAAPTSQPASQPTTAPAEPQPQIEPANMVVFGLMIDRPPRPQPEEQPQVIKGLRADRPPEPPVVILGTRPNRPIRPEELTPTTQPASQPTTAPAQQPQIENPNVTILGLMVDRPQRREPAERIEPQSIDEPSISIDGIRPDRPRPRASTTQPTSQPTTAPLEPLPQIDRREMTVYGLMVDRPPRRENPPPSTPTTAPAKEQPANEPPTVVFGARIDRPQPPKPEDRQ